MPVPALDPPVLPEHELMERIGAGAYGEVWLARNLATGAQRAVKIVRRSTFTEERPFNREFEGIKKFDAVSRTHPSQLALFHVGRNDAAGFFYYVMELADSTTTEGPYRAHTLRYDLERGRLPAARVLEIAVALTEALAHLHANGLIHRDVKPSNIIFVGGRPRLADIGLVTDASDSRSIVGTEGYLPREGPGTAGADVYALGKVLYEALTGMDRRKYPELPADLREWSDAKLAFELNTILLKACASNASERYPNAQACLTDFKHLVAGKSVKRRRAMQRLWALTGKLAVIVSLLCAAAWLYSVKRDRAFDMWKNKGLPLSAFKNSGTTNMAAWQASERGTQMIAGYSVHSMSNALREFEHAVQLDPNYARGWSTIAITLALAVDYGYIPASAGLSRARACVEKALQMEPENGFAFCTLAEIILAQEYDFPTAERLYRKGLKLVPPKVSADQNFARLLTYYGRFDEAEKLLQGINSVAPGWGATYIVTACLYAAMGRHSEAISKFELAARLDDRPFLYVHRADLLSALNDREGAARDLLRAVELDGIAGLNPRPDGQNLRRVLEDHGAEEFLRAHIRVLEDRRKEGEFISSYDFARLYAHAGDKEKALEHLEAGVDEHRCMSLGVKVNPLFKTFHGGPRFHSVLRRLKLE